jgi:hypothetical protein
MLIKRFVPTRRAEGKGRNGYFRVGMIELWRDAYGQGLYIDISSTRPGQSPPCRLTLDPEDALQLARLIQDVCRDPSEEEDGGTIDA